MNIIVAKDYEEMSRIAAEHLLALMYQRKRINLAITGGSSPTKMYEMLAPRVKNNAYFSNVHYYNFDEIPFKGQDRAGITLKDITNKYLEPASVPGGNIHPLTVENYSKQDERIKEDGGLDAILIGIGEDGHFCGNLPGTTRFENETYCIQTDEVPGMREMLKAVMGGDETAVPDRWVTMGPKSVMHARQIILIANGTKKAKILKKALQGRVTEDIPSSILQLHPNLTVILDQEAAQLLAL